MGADRSAERPDRSTRRPRAPKGSSMTPNSFSPPLTGTAATAEEGFARRRMHDVAGIAAIVGTILAVALITGVDTPLFAVAMLAALGALVFGEQRLTAGEQRSQTAHHGFSGRHARA